MKPNYDLIYHQKSVLVENIIRYVRRYNTKSLLDIGAGTSATAAAISRSVENYLAVEMDEESAEELKRAGLNVIKGKFPLPVNQTFDLVLSSHSIPERALEEYTYFLSEAWKMLNPGGIFLIVTFKGCAGSLDEVRRELFDFASQVSAEYKAVLAFLENRGEVSIEKINSYIQAASAESLADFLSPWLIGKRVDFAEKTLLLLHILNTRYKVSSDLFVFPTEHLFISCKKPASSASETRGSE